MQVLESLIVILLCAWSINSQVAPEPLGATWPDQVMPVPYCVNVLDIPRDRDGHAVLQDQKFVTLVQEAFRKWQSLPDSYITFKYTGLCSSSPSDNNDGANTIGFGQLPRDIAGLSVLGSTGETPLHRSLTGDLLEVDITVDRSLATEFAATSTFVDYVLPVVLLHEAGHFLGLDHASSACSVMNPSTVQIDFCWLDIAAMRELYPGPEKATNLEAHVAGCAEQGASVWFSWIASPEAEGYYIDVSEDAGFDSWLPIAAPGQGITATEQITLRADTVYYARIWTYGYGLGSHTVPVSFVTPRC